jgi:hypothetical protein
VSVLSRMLGNAATVSPADAQVQFQQILCPGECIQHAYKLIRDFFLFTDRRLILVDKQGLTGRKTDYHSIPYKSITHFSVETAGHFDLDAEMKIWVSGNSLPYKKKFTRQVNIYDVQATLANYVLPRDSGASGAPDSASHRPSSVVTNRSVASMPSGHAMDDGDPQPISPTDSESEAKALFEFARAAAKANNRDRAVELLERIVRDYPSTRYAGLARNSLATAR